MRLLISGGGTGGHIYPALALIDTLKKDDDSSTFLYVGTNRGLESKIVPNAGIDFKTIEIQGFKRSLSLQNFKTIYLFLKSVHEAKKIIKEFKPDVVVGTGGYVCGAVVYAASQMHIPTFIHEQNSIAGVTNKFLSHFVDKIGICFEAARKEFPSQKVVFTGNPRAQQVANIKPTGRLAELGLSENKKTVLVFGGSRGARRINEATIEAFSFFNTDEFQVLFVTGSIYYEKIKNELGEKELKNIVIKPYIQDMPAILPEIDLIVGRSGATSLAEITVLGIPSILIPSPNVTHDHQTYNARSLADIDAAIMIKEDSLSGKTLSAEVNKLMKDDERRSKIAKEAKKAGIPDSSKRIEKVLTELINK
ncbi:MAG: undecaprenyldiphospho-muramoylpentapeptide beta-N-acetylglucosaminyltransferase [Liquorilactobacillus hordei]|uniref:undecaprenyldiphospho-muramoylpentapeptide beta-N-acetylglucosaminyltransferase n=1 Tax=Liquorilactobacillus hordei TaxID=468911 RepID=UPI0039E7D344